MLHGTNTRVYISLCILKKNSQSKKETGIFRYPQSQLHKHDILSGRNRENWVFKFELGILNSDKTVGVVMKKTREELKDQESESV